MNKIVKHTLDSTKPTPLTKQQKAQLKALANAVDEDIDYSDIPPLDHHFWEKAVRNPFYKPVKTSTTVRIDSDILLWLKSKGRGYQTKINAILRASMLKELAKSK
jgi:uncharacterized protein (DUF4415 family)